MALDGIGRHVSCFVVADWECIHGGNNCCPSDDDKHNSVLHPRTILDKGKMGRPLNESLYASHIIDVEGAYIIRINGNQTSEQLAARCAASCEQVGQNYRFWEAYNGSSNPIGAPSHHNDTMSMIKVIDPYLTRSEVACALSHISLWVHCVLIDRPIVVLEHDAIMLHPYRVHGVFNSIAYLGSAEQHHGGWDVTPIPPVGSRGRNFRFILRAHAYAIDPAVAKTLVSYVLQHGIHTSLDTMIRADLFPIHQMGLFAFDAPEETTIVNRPPDGERQIIKNDYLEI